jgi:hypothetical protein
MRTDVVRLSASSLVLLIYVSLDGLEPLRQVLVNEPVRTAKINLIQNVV